MLLDGPNARITYVFKGLVSRKTTAIYDDMDCLLPLVTYKETRTITLGSELSSPAGAKEIDIKIKESTATMRSSAAVEEANAIKAFGYSDWKLDEPKNIPGPFAPEPDESLDDMIYQIFKIQDDQLLTGDPATGGTKNPSERPVSLDQSFVLKKQ